MMPNPSRPAAPRLPPVDEAVVPFSELFENGFDRATIDATAQLADQSIFVASNGRRFRLERIPDPDPGPIQARTPGASPIASVGLGPAHSVPLHPPPAPSPTSSSAPVVAQIAELDASDSAPSSSWRRPPSDASFHSRSPDGYPVRPGQGRCAVPGAQANIATHEVTNMMSHLSVSRFGAAPLYRESDGGVQAAETLTDPYWAPRSPIDPSSPIAATPILSHSQLSQPTDQQPPVSGTPYHGRDNSGISPVTWPNINYVDYTAQANFHVQNSRQAAVTPSGLPSLMEGSTPLSPAHGTSDSDPIPNFSPDSVSYVATSTEYPSPPVYTSATAPPSLVGRRPSYITAVGKHRDMIDTLTPVVVLPHTPSNSSDGGSTVTGRDNVLPGEDALFDGPVKSAPTLAAPMFREGVLKVFRNTLTNDLRFYCRVDRESETYWMKANNAQLVPAYAYDQRLSNIVYVRDREHDKGGSGYVQASQANGRPSGIYQFPSLKDLFDFQAKLTGEKVVLDIGSVRMVRLSKANSRSSTAYSSARLQIWHEAEGGRRKTQSDGASFVTAGTALSGPLRTRTVVSSSRLLLYLGRLGEYITVYITDDLEVVTEGSTVVKLKPRKNPIPFSKMGSRFTWVKAHQEPSHGSEPAGLDISGKVVEVDVDSYDSYKTFEIEFENSPSQDNFLRKWDEVIRERRLQRARLAQIEEDMKRNVFTGRQARAIKT